MGQIEDHNQSQQAADDTVFYDTVDIPGKFFWSIAFLFYIIAYKWLFPHNIPYFPHYILHYNIFQFLTELWIMSEQWIVYSDPLYGQYQE